MDASASDREDRHSPVDRSRIGGNGGDRPNGKQQAAQLSKWQSDPQTPHQTDSLDLGKQC